MYHDIWKENSLFFYIPENEIENDIKQHRITPNGDMIFKSPQIEGMDTSILEYFKKIRIVFGMMELINYVRFREKLAIFYSTKQDNVSVQDDNNLQQ